MRRPAIIAAALLITAPALAQVSDRSLLEAADFSSLTIKEMPPEGANGVETALWSVRKQLTGRDFYEPANYMFVRPAVRELGLIPAVFATSDRILRDTRIGTVQVPLDPADPFIHEGPEAYKCRREETARSLVKCTAVPLAQSTAFPSSSRWVSKDYEFVQYLIENDLKSDARQLLFGQSFHPSDTLTFLKGWALYQLKELEPAGDWLQAVPQASGFYDKAFFYSNAISAHLGDYTGPAERLEAYSGPYAELKGMQLAGLALLRDDPDAFRSASSAFRYNDFALEAAEHEMDGIFDQRYNSPQKSPWVAAAASALVPGLGKIYAGQIGEGVSSFLITGAMGAITAEHWIKDGPKDWKTIVPGVLTAILYIGSIYGSYMSVSIYNTRVNDAQDTAVLYNVHIPLRSVFK